MVVIPFDARSPGWVQDRALSDLVFFRRTSWEDKTVIMQSKTMGKHMLQWHGYMAEQSMLNAYTRAYFRAYEELGELGQAMGEEPPEKRRKQYADELGHACMEIKAFQHLCGVIPVLEGLGASVSPAAGSAMGHGFPVLPIVSGEIQTLGARSKF